MTASRLGFMPIKTSLSITLMAVLLSSCATLKAPEQDQDVTASTQEPAELPQAELVASLPKEVESFELAGAQAFDTDGDGVTVRYANPRKHRRADVFVYPVAEKNKKLAHPELVFGSTQATMQAIAQAVQEGIYQNLNVIDAATKANGFKAITTHLDLENQALEPANKTAALSEL